MRTNPGYSGHCDVFIACAGADLSLSDDVRDRFRELDPGIRVSCQTDSQPGAGLTYDWVENARCVLVLVSKTYCACLDCLDLFHLALARWLSANEPFLFLPVCLETIEDIPTTLRHVEMLDGRGGNRVSLVRMLTEAVTDWVRGESEIRHRDTGLLCTTLTQAYKKSENTAPEESEVTTPGPPIDLDFAGVGVDTGYLLGQDAARHKLSVAPKARARPRLHVGRKKRQTSHQVQKFGSVVKPGNLEIEPILVAKRQTSVRKRYSVQENGLCRLRQLPVRDKDHLQRPEGTIALAYSKDSQHLVDIVCSKLDHEIPGLTVDHVLCTNDRECDSSSVDAANVIVIFISTDFVKLPCFHEMLEACITAYRQGPKAQLLYLVKCTTLPKSPILPQLLRYNVDVCDPIWGDLYNDWSRLNASVTWTQDVTTTLSGVTKPLYCTGPEYLALTMTYKDIVENLEYGVGKLREQQPFLLNILEVQAKVNGKTVAPRIQLEECLKQIPNGFDQNSDEGPPAAQDRESPTVSSQLISDASEEKTKIPEQHAGQLVDSGDDRLQTDQIGSKQGKNDEVGNHDSPGTELNQPGHGQPLQEGDAASSIKDEITAHEGHQRDGNGRRRSKPSGPAQVECQLKGSSQTRETSVVAKSNTDVRTVSKPQTDVTNVALVEDNAPVRAHQSDRKHDPAKSRETSGRQQSSTCTVL